jgi:hypothetical protein
MSEPQARVARDDVYDHEDHDPRSRRRRRPVADWGVGDDVFEHMPRRRFSRASEGPPRERRFTSRDGAAGEAASRDGAEHGPAGGASRDGAEQGPAGDAPRGKPADGRRTIVIGRPEDLPSEIAAITADRDLGEEEPAFTEPAAGTGHRPTGERRTVRIGGRPEGSLEAARFHREHARRPPRTAHERVGARPDRLAMWAFALGMLLIVIALLSAT